MSGAGAFGESPEVAALTVLLRALADPQDALALITVLRGAAVRHQRSGAVRVQAGRRLVQPVSRARVTPGADAGRAHAALAGAASVLPVDARAAGRRRALNRILEHCGYLALAATTPGGVDAGDILHAVDRVRQVVEKGGSLADAADSLEADTEALNEVESLPLEPGPH